MIAKKPVIKRQRPTYTFLTFWVLLTLVVCNQTVKAQNESCVAVAIVYGTDICKSQIVLSEKEILDLESQFQQDPLILRKNIDRARQKKLEHLIIQTAIRQELDPAFSVTPKAETINQYVSRLKETMNDRYSNNKKIIDLISTLLEKNKYSLENRRKLEGIKRAAEISIRFFEARSDFQKEAPEEFTKMSNHAGHDVAEDFVREWFIGKILYEHYGGRLVSLGQNLLSPLDAYQAFVNDIKDNVEITDPNYISVLEQMIPVPENALNIVSPSEEDTYQYYYSDILWHLKNRGTNTELERSKQKLLSVPTLNDL